MSVPDSLLFNKKIYGLINISKQFHIHPRIIRCEFNKILGCVKSKFRGIFSGAYHLCNSIKLIKADS